MALVETASMCSLDTHLFPAAPWHIHPVG